jgi:hypothetical protein
MTRRAAALLALVALAGPALAEPDVKSMAGPWTLSGSHEAEAACRLTLAAEQTIGGWDLQLPKACLKAFPQLADVTAWTIYADHSGDIGLIDALRKTVFRFARAGDAYVTHPAKAGVQLVLTRDAGSHAPSAQQRMSGGWSLTGMGGIPPLFLHLHRKCGWHGRNPDDEAGLCGQMEGHGLGRLDPERREADPAGQGRQAPAAIHPRRPRHL